MRCETAPRVGTGPVTNAGATLSGLAAAIDAVTAEIEEDWRARGVVGQPAADRLHELVESARRLAGA